MNNYPEFKREYIATLTEILKEPVADGVLGVIGTRRSRALVNKLTDLEELHPAWAERIEDWLASEDLLQ